MNFKEEAKGIVDEWREVGWEDYKGTIAILDLVNRIEAALKDSYFTGHSERGLDFDRRAVESIEKNAILEDKLNIAIQALEDVDTWNEYHSGLVAEKALDKIRGKK